MPRRAHSTQSPVIYRVRHLSISSCDINMLVVLACSLVMAVVGLASEPDEAHAGGELVSTAAARQPALPERLRSTSHPDPAAQLAKASDSLRQAMEQLDRRLDCTPHGSAWRRYLMWDSLKRELAAATNARSDVLRAVQLRFRSGHEGLELEDFRNVKSALETYVDALHSVQSPDYPSEFRSRLEALAAALEAAPGASSLPVWLAGGQALAWLRAHGLPPELAAEAGQHLSHPNLVFRASRDLVAAGVDRAVEESAPIVDCILGTRIYGSGRTRGKVVLELLPNQRQGVFQAQFVGINDSRTVGYNRSAIIYARGRTQLWGTRQILLNESGLRALGVVADAATRTTITGIDSSRRGLMGRVVRRVASRKAARQKPLAEAVAGGHAAERFRERFTSQMDAALARGQESFQSRFRGPLVRWDLFPERLAFGTTREYLVGTVAQEGAEWLAAPQPAPEVSGDPLLAVRLHESLIVNTASGLLAGRTLDREMVERLARDFLGYTPEQVRELLFKEEGAWTMTFAPVQPVEFTIDDGGFTLTLHGRRFTSGKLGRPTRFDAMDITARYRLEVGERGLRAVREGDLHIVPGGHAAGKPLGARQIAQIRWVRGKFEKILKPQFERRGEDLVLGGSWSQLGELLVQLESAEDGWLCLAWNRVNAEASVGGVGTRRSAMPAEEQLAAMAAALANPLPAPGSRPHAAIRGD